MNSVQHTVVGLGEALWDMLPSGKHLGGAPLNFAYIASLLGDRSLIATRIGNDALGEEIQHELTARGLDITAMQIDDALPTGTVDVTFSNGQPAYEIRKPAAWDNMQFSPEWQDIGGTCDALCFGTLAQREQASRATIKNLLAHTRPECLRVFDINLRRPFYSKEIIEESIRLASVLKMNDLELPEVAAMFGIESSTNQDRMRALLNRFGLRAIFVTCGERGAMALTTEAFAHHPGFPIRVQDTIGAGDAFAAAATHSLLSGHDLQETLEFANGWASWVASQAGGMPKLEREHPATSLLRPQSLHR